MSKWISEFRRGWRGVSEPSIVLSSAFVAFCLLIGTLMRWGISLIRPDSPYTLYLPAVLFATVFGGVRAGVAATVGGGLLGFVLNFGIVSHRIALLALFAIYAIVAALIIWGIEHYRAIAARQRTLSDRLIKEEKYRKLIVDELQHRLKNKLSTIHAVIHQVLHNQPEVWSKIDDRIRALSAADDLIAKADEKGCDIRELLLSELGPYEHVRFTLNGDALYLPAKLAVSLSLMFHELATNAAKYGAFFSPTGLLHVSWNVSQNVLTIVWDETGGPLVTSVGKAGFGTKLLNSALAAFHGRIEMLFLETGFHCSMRCEIPDHADPLEQKAG
jgi:two-component sensor histidine kinase